MSMGRPDHSAAFDLILRGGTVVTDDREQVADLGISGRQRIRDLWRQQDVGESDGQFSSTVASHGVRLVRIIPAR